MGAVIAAAAAAGAVGASSRRSAWSSRKIYILSRAGEHIRTQKDLLNVVRHGLSLVSRGICAWEDFESEFSAKDLPSRTRDSQQETHLPEYMHVVAMIRDTCSQSGTEWIKIGRVKEKFAKVLFAIQTFPLSTTEFEIFAEHPNYRLKKFVLDSQCLLDVITEEDAVRMAHEWPAGDRKLPDAKVEPPPWLHEDLLFSPKGTLKLANKLSDLYRGRSRIGRWFQREDTEMTIPALCSEVRRGKKWRDLMPFSCLTPQDSYLLPYWMGEMLPPIWYNLIEVIERDDIKLSSQELAALLQHPHWMVREAAKKKQEKN